MIARDIMTESPVTISPSTTVVEAAEILLDNEIRHLPVVEGRELVGMISDRDLRGLYIPRFEDEDALRDAQARYDAPISTLMTPDVVSLEPDADLQEIIGQLLEQKVGAIAVTDASTGDLLGIVSYVDVLRALYEG